jgi:hypothetical protein
MEGSSRGILEGLSRPVLDEIRIGFTSNANQKFYCLNHIARFTARGESSLSCVSCSSDTSIVTYRRRIVHLVFRTGQRPVNRKKN